MVRDLLGHLIPKSFNTSDELRSIIDGLLLGDGSINTKKYKSKSGPKSGTFILRVKETSFDWVMLVKSKFDQLGIKSNIRHNPAKKDIIQGRIINRGPSVVLETCGYTNFLNEYERWYPNGTKIVPQDVCIDPVSLAHWYMGDGCLNINKTDRLRITFFTNGFTYEDVLELKDRMNIVYGISGSVQLQKKKFPIMNFTTRHALILLNIMRPHIVQCFRYKVDNIKYEMSNCVVCGIELRKQYGIACKNCHLSYQKACNHNRRDNDINIIELAKEFRNGLKPVCLICGLEFNNRIGVKYCFNCRNYVRKFNKTNIRFGDDRIGFFEFIRGKM